MKLFVLSSLMLVIFACGSRTDSGVTETSLIKYAAEPRADERRCGTSSFVGGDSDFLTRDSVSSIDAIYKTGEAAVKRYEQLGISGGTVTSIKTWIEPEYTWTRLTYQVKPSGGNQAKENDLILSCHAHGSQFGCHKQTRAGTLEPKETTSGPNPNPTASPSLKGDESAIAESWEEQPIEEELPPIEF